MLLEDTIADLWLMCIHACPHAYLCNIYRNMYIHKHTVIHSRTKIYVTTLVSDVYSTFVVFHSSNSPASPSSTRFSVTAFWYVPFYLILHSGMIPGHEHGTHCLFYKEPSAQYCGGRTLTNVSGLAGDRTWWQH